MRMHVEEELTVPCRYLNQQTQSSIVVSSTPTDGLRNNQLNIQANIGKICQDQPQTKRTLRTQFEPSELVYKYFQ
jgi:hypothetical protein